MLKSREEAARFIEKQFHHTYKCSLPKGHSFHYRKQEVKELMDYVYGGPPSNEKQFIKIV